MQKTQFTININKKKVNLHENELVYQKEKRLEKGQTNRQEFLSNMYNDRKKDSYSFIHIKDRNNKIMQIEKVYWELDKD